MQQIFKIKNVRLSSWPPGVPKTAEISPDCFILTTEGMVLNFFDMIDIDI